MSFIFKLKDIKVFQVLKTVANKELILKKWCPELFTKVEIDTFNSITDGVFSQQ